MRETFADAILKLCAFNDSRTCDVRCTYHMRHIDAKLNCVRVPCVSVSVCFLVGNEIDNHRIVIKIFYL